MGTELRTRVTWVQFLPRSLSIYARGLLDGHFASNEMNRDIEKQRANQRRWYARNKEKQLQWNKAVRLRLVEFVKDYKKAHPCQTCGESDWRCLDFHHRDPNTKTSGLNRVARKTSSMKKVLEEIEKCDVLCANCHRKVTWPLSSNG